VLVLVHDRVELALGPDGHETESVLVSPQLGERHDMEPCSPALGGELRLVKGAADDLELLTALVDALHRLEAGHRPADRLADVAMLTEGGPVDDTAPVDGRADVRDDRHLAARPFVTGRAAVGHPDEVEHRLLGGRLDRKSTRLN